jgi:UDP-glucose 4-epimerase
MEVVRGIKRITDQALPRRLAPRQSSDVAQCWEGPSRAAEKIMWRAHSDLEALADHWRWQIQNPNGYSQ